MFIRLTQASILISLIFLGALSLNSLTGCAAVATGTAAGIAISPDRRTAGTIIDDQTLRFKAQSVLNKDKALNENSHLSTLAYNNTLLLVGQVPSEHMRLQAFERVRDLPHVQRIYNEITVQKPSNFSRRTKDTWITARVKTKFMTNKVIGPGRLSVITENGVVYLMGMLNDEEAHTATKLARDISGVKKIVPLFEPVQDHHSAPVG